MKWKISIGVLVAAVLVSLAVRGLGGVPADVSSLPTDSPAPSSEVRTTATPSLADEFDTLGNRRVEVRPMPGGPARDTVVCGGWYEDTKPTELWVIDSETGEERKVLESGGIHQANTLELGLCDMDTPRFSLDGKYVYFISTAWATSSALWELEFSTGNVRFIDQTTSLLIVPTGEYVGKLVIRPHQYYDFGGSYDDYYIIDRWGKRLAHIGPDLDRFEEN